MEDSRVEDSDEDQRNEVLDDEGQDRVRPSRVSVRPQLDAETAIESQFRVIDDLVLRVDGDRGSHRNRRHRDAKHHQHRRARRDLGRQGEDDQYVAVDGNGRQRQRTGVDDDPVRRRDGVAEDAAEDPVVRQLVVEGDGEDEGADEDVGEGEVCDEDVRRRPHLWASDDDGEDEDVADRSENNDDDVDDDDEDDERRTQTEDVELSRIELVIAQLWIHYSHAQKSIYYRPTDRLIDY